jgi:hypothetical protein
MTLQTDSRRWTWLVPMVALMLGLCSAPASGQTTLNASIRVDVVFGDRVKMEFDRSAVAIATTAVDPSTVTPALAAPLTVTAKARTSPNQRVVLTAKADGPFRSGPSTIPANKLSWTATGTGFTTAGTANENTARRVGDWRGSGVWTGVQTYAFADDWNYAVGVYTLTMTYTLTMP